MGEQARLWQRVSSGGQDEASQLPDLIRWCDDHEYEYDADKRYVLHGKSASKGKHQAELDRAIDDMAHGLYTVLVVWQSSRIERRGAFDAFDLARRVRDAGGRIEYVQDSYLNASNEMSDVMLALAATKDKQKSLDISKQVKAKHAALRESGSVIGRAPWGYRIVKLPDGRKRLEPTEAGRKYIPLIYERLCVPETPRDIARWLDAERVPTVRGGRWSEGYLVHRLIPNPTYMGRRPNSGNLEIEALVSPSVWRQANAAVKARARPGRDTSTHEKALLKPVCGECGRESPMYRIFAGKDRTAFYRCTGRGPQRKGCGFMVPCDPVDREAVRLLCQHPDPHREHVFTPGDSHADEVVRLRERGAEAFRRGDYAEAQAVIERAAQLESEPSTPPRWDWVETSITEGAYFAGLDASARRRYLLDWRVVLSRRGLRLEGPWEQVTK